VGRLLRGSRTYSDIAMDEWNKRDLLKTLDGGKTWEHGSLMDCRSGFSIIFRID